MKMVNNIQVTVENLTRSLPRIMVLPGIMAWVSSRKTSRIKRTAEKIKPALNAMSAPKALW